MIEHHIPYDTLDQFYFEEVLPIMHPAIRQLATDLRVLRGESNSQQVNSLRFVYDTQYMYTPWYLDDIFQLAPEPQLAIGKGNMLLAMAYVALDQTVDQQMPADPIVPLVHQHLWLAAHQHFQGLFEKDHPFWERYYHYIHLFFRSLAIESLCLDAREQPYTYDTMKVVCKGKALPFHIAAHAMAHQSGDLALCDTLYEVFSTTLLFDQIWDDSLDWKDDFKAGRCTLPILMALESAGADFETASLEVVQQEIETQGILVQLCNVAMRDLYEAKRLLEEAQLQQTKLYLLLNKREENFKFRRRTFGAMSFLGGIIRLLSPTPVSSEL